LSTVKAFKSITGIGSYKSFIPDSAIAPRFMSHLQKQIKSKELRKIEGFFSEELLNKNE